MIEQHIESPGDAVEAVRSLLYNLYLAGDTRQTVSLGKVVAEAHLETGFEADELLDIVEISTDMDNPLFSQSPSGSIAFAVSGLWLLENISAHLEEGLDYNESVISQLAKTSLRNLVTPHNQ